ncbi:CRISPR-associated protein [Lusitaniella coriacea LEGE 07157]|uniref:CRISPR-associated protein n=1 Tax=Lusitaniella coriacea LEGE 07157 TaxID=945747 RepID=A0A8J7IXG8_9CYAN|nr:CRISPR-associated protein [Lusitaniella coriacea]MBE9118738.1 CRISPR-associated protein [Lusitaniella coriacea LEGE 07157]
MKQRNPIIEWVTDPTKNFLTSFLVGTLLFTIISDGISALFWDNLSEWLQAKLNIEELSTFRLIVVVVLILAIFVLIYVTPFSRWLKRRLVRTFGNTPQTVQTNVRPLRETFPGLIAVMGRTLPNDESPAERAILHHWNGGQTPHLLHCWIVCTQQSESSAQELQKKLIDKGLSQGCALHYGDDYWMDDPENFGEQLNLCVADDLIDDPIYIQRLINCIYADACTRYDLDESEMIADFTGGTKSMSAGILLACATAARRLQYISQLGNRELMEIEIAYKLVPDKSA